MTLSSEERGFKRICTSCGTRFYDFGKRPIICPNCSNEFSLDVKTRGRKGRNSAVEAEEAPAKTESKVKPIGKDKEEDTEVGEEFVSLDELEEIEKGDDDEDLDLDDDLDDDLEVIEDEDSLEDIEAELDIDK